ncbi:MAG: FAD-dependent oxidoreductase [Planctomycetaceae bacterium]|nr:FAD-dependent oxidoreductase [Planctomycetaceae bacterium]
MRPPISFLSCFVLIALAAAPLPAEIVWLEAEQFEESGGWLNDAQFIDQMGSPYLLAVGLGKPVADASTTATLPRPGKYRLWVRAKDWVPEHHPGKFQVLVNRQAAAEAFGANGKKGWSWEDGGVYDLSGKVELKVHDLTGYYGRCDVVVLTDDLGWIPPQDTAAIAALRETHGGVSRAVEVMPEVDVVVVGGGLAGCTAAVAAARNGCSTVLIQNRPILGGNASSEILVPPVGAWAGIYRSKYPLDPRETGIVDEYRTAGNQRVSEGKLYSNRLLRLVRLEPNLDLHLNTHATGVEMQPGKEKRIAAVDAVDVRSGKRMRFPAKVFLDCTGDSVVGVAAGAEYRQGKEPKSMYNEPWAPDEPSKHTMGNGLKYFARDMGEPRPFEAPSWIYPYPTCDSFNPERHPKLTTSIEIDYQWMIELGGLRDTYADAEEIRDDLLRLIYGLWDHTKNRCDRDKERAANYELAWVGHIAGKRENRRLIGDYVLTQNDIGEQTLFPDRVAFGAWSVDDHYSGGFFHQGATAQHRDRTESHYMGVPFSIPFRCLYSKNVDNLLMAGRNISASHLGMSDTRVMLTCAVMGHAAGTGAAFCVHEQTTPRGVCQNHMAALQQQLLKEGATIFELQADDAHDLARKATATASSWRTHTSGEKMLPENVMNGLARAVGERMKETTNAWGPDPSVAGPHWVELAWAKPVTFNMVHVSFQTTDTVPRSFAVEARCKGQWQKIVEIDDNRHRRHVLGLDQAVTADAIRLSEDEPSAVCEIRVYDEPQRLVEIAQRAHANMRLPDEGPWLPWGDDDRSMPGLDPKKLEGLVFDDTTARQFGGWVHSTWSDHFVGEDYLHDGNEGKGLKTLRFRVKVAESGRYEIRLGYVAYTNRASRVPVTVRIGDRATVVHVDQTKKPPIQDLFLPLGTFDLTAGEEAVVEISNADTEGYVVADCVQAVKK